MGSPQSRPTIHVIDSHTGGEPTRVVISGGPPLTGSTTADQLADFRSRFDTYRSAIVNEPRGSDVMVGALLVPSQDPSCCTGVIFFNNVGYLGMCGHGTIGVIATLAHLGRLQPGTHRIETCVGVVQCTLHDDGRVSVTNVPSHRRIQNLSVRLSNGQSIRGDIAWGGNWFFLAESPIDPIDLSHVELLTSIAWEIRQAVNAQGHPEVDHVELFGRAQSGGDSRNFVLCPGKAYDRSPCGTGTSAKLACLAADGSLEEGEEWIQESILGSRFTGTFRWLDRAQGTVIPVITGSAFVTGESRLLLDPNDPFCWGIRG